MCYNYLIKYTLDYMTHYIASDLHFSHRNILQYCPNRRSGKPLPITLEGIDEMIIEMNEKIISNWNNLVLPDDEVSLLGDMAMGKIADAPGLIRRLNGKKHLIKGNHDKTLCKLPEVNELFESIQDYKEITYKYNGKKHLICMFHFPIASWNGMSHENSSIHLHGHTHCSHGHHISAGAIMDVGIDGNDLFPYRLDQVVELALQNAKNNPPKHHH